MTYAQKTAVIITALAALLIFGWAQRAESEDPITTDPAPSATTTEATSSTPVVPGEAGIPEDRKDLALEAYLRVQANGTKDPEEWLLALEWCESNEDPTAINPVDRDGTASYGLLQFKPDTFTGFAKAYGVPGDLMDPDAQRAIVRAMMHDKSIDWSWQFPDCVKRHIGWPPAVIE